MTAAAGLSQGLPVRARAALGLRGGWRRIIAAFGIGAVAVAALPPVHAVFVLPVSFTGLLWLVETARNRRAAFAAGWWFGFGYFAAGLYWVAYAFMVEAERYAALAPLAVLGLSVYLALFPAFAALAVHRWGGAPWARPLVLAAAWVAGEWLRGILFTGFPWNLVGSVWIAFDAMIQPAAWIGVYGLSLLTVFVAASPAVMAHGSGVRAWGAGLAALALLAGWWGAGAGRLAAAADETVPGVKLRIVQGSIPQHLKWRPDLREAHLASYLALSGYRGGGATHVIWPETAVPFVLAVDERRRAAVATAAPEGGYVITGAVRTTPPGVEPYEAWNSLHAIAPDGTVVATYDKFHLVPFGEYIPLRGVLPFRKLTEGRGDFSAGPGPRTLAVDGLPPFSPLVCYEVIFPGNVTAPGATRPEWMLNVTNDAWFGVSSGPYQHLAAARLRAVEEGLPLVRAANTGISAVIDAHGRVRHRLGLEIRGTIDAPLPAPLSAPTVFSRYGGPLLAALLLGAFVAGPLSRRVASRGMKLRGEAT
jgi:apolipoprotein N-acyltransferase